MEKLTTAQAAARSGASRFAIHRAIKSGALHPVRDNRGRYLFDAEELDAWSATRAHLVAQSLRDDSATEPATDAAQSELDALRDRLAAAEKRATDAEKRAAVAEALALGGEGLTAGWLAYGAALNEGRYRHIIGPIWCHFDASTRARATRSALLGTSTVR